MKKELYIWIYEYRDDKTHIGVTFLEGFISKLDYNIEEIILPHLQEPWHWRIEITYKYLKKS